METSWTVELVLHQEREQNKIVGVSPETLADRSGPFEDVRSAA